MPLDSQDFAEPAAVNLSAPLAGAHSNRAPVGPARAAVARLLRDQGAALLQSRRAAVYLPGVLGAPRLFATASATNSDGDLSGPTGDQGVSPLRLAAVRAASGGSGESFLLELAATRNEPAGAVLVVSLEGHGWLVVQRDGGWPPEEKACALALARTILRLLAGTSKDEPLSAR